MIVGTAGHIDHGKTALVRCLTGVDADRLKEEKERGITIDLGFAYWTRPDGDVVGFVDVPGHERLVHNMLAGATGIDHVLLVIAADDGVMPQTREHLSILNLLGLGNGVVALNKSDLVTPERIAAVTADVSGLLEGTALASAPIIPVSAKTGEGMAALAGHLDDARAATRPRSSDGRFRLAIDRCFTLQGLGTAVTGTVISGTVAVNDKVMISPDGLEARVRSIHAQDRAASSGAAGQRCALVLSGAQISKETVHRGAMVVDPELHAPTQRIDARLSVLRSEHKPVGHWTPVRVHHGSAEVGGRVVVLRHEPVAAGQSEFVQLVLEKPIAAAVHDRFILRDTSSSRTIGGGVFIDLRAPERKRRTQERLAMLQALSIPGHELALRAALSGPAKWVELLSFFRDRGAHVTDLIETSKRLEITGLPWRGQMYAMLRSDWNRYCEQCRSVLDDFHKTNPELPGFGIERLRLLLEPRLPPAVFPGALERLIVDGIADLDRSWVRRPGYEVQLSPEEERLWLRLHPLLADIEPFRPPRVRDMARELQADEQQIRRVCRLAARRGDVDEIASDHYFCTATVIEMADIVRSLATSSSDGRFSVIEFRDKLNNGRKVAIQILEFFDRHGLTMRRGDFRRINPHRADLFSNKAASANSTATATGGVPFPVGRPDFKSGWGRQTVPGGFDSHPPPPVSARDPR